MEALAVPLDGAGWLPAPAHLGLFTEWGAQSVRSGSSNLHSFVQ